MNKLQRHQTKMRKYRQRLKRLGIKVESHRYRTSGKPCSCAFCKKERYSRKQKHKNNDS